MFKNDANASQTKRRISETVEKMLCQLILLAQKIPEDEAHHFLPRDSVIKLIISLLKEAKDDLSSVARGDTDLKDIPIFDEGIPNASRAYLASTLAEVSLSSIARQYQSLSRDTPNLAGTNLDHIKRCILICKEIAYAIELDQQKKLAIKESLEYLLKWDELPGKDIIKFLDYLGSEFGQAFSTPKIERSLDNRVMSFSTSIPEGDIVVGKISIDSNWKKAIMTFDDDPTDEDRRTFIVEKDNNGTYLFKRRK